MAAPLRPVVARGPLPERPGYGWYDTLSCGHVVRFDGYHAEQRRCPECPPIPAAAADGVAQEMLDLTD